MLTEGCCVRVFYDAKRVLPEFSCLPFWGIAGEKCNIFGMHLGVVHGYRLVSVRPYIFTRKLFFTGNIFLVDCNE